MVKVCTASAYIAFFIMVVLSNILFVIAVKNADEDKKTLVLVKFLFEFFVFVTLPLLLSITQGVCGAE